MTQRFETKIEEALVRMKAGCKKKTATFRKWSVRSVAFLQRTAAFRIQKSDPSIRPIWHHKEGRVLDELSEIHSMDVVLPTKSGLEIRTRCVSKPTDHQQILLDKLGLNLPTKINLKQV